LYLRPRNKFVATFMGETNLLEGRVTGVDGQRAVVETPLGPVTARQDGDGVRAGDPVTLSLRPEAVRIGEVSGDWPNVFAATIHDTAYLGEVAQHRVTINDHATLKVFELNPKFVARDGAQERVTVWFDPGDVVVMKN
jgi:ABC-type Fe3+/spermidine/putrescine transport system ATPase subunit